MASSWSRTRMTAAVAGLGALGVAGWILLPRRSGLSSTAEDGPVHPASAPAAPRAGS